MADHSSRVLVLKIAAKRSFMAGQSCRDFWSGSDGVAGQAEALEQVGVELRLDAPRRHPLAVRRLVDLVEGRAGVEHVGAPLLVPDAHEVEGVDHRHQRGRAVDHGGVDHLALARAGRLEQGGHHAEGEQHAPAAEVAHQVERRHRRRVGPAQRPRARRRWRCSRCRARPWAPSARPGPSPSCARRPGGGCARSRRRARGPAARPRRAGTPRSARPTARRARARARPRRGSSGRCPPRDGTGSAGPSTARRRTP